MKCAKPYRRGIEAFGCGQCMPCRFNRRRLWTARLMLEASQHEACCFATLTYREDMCPRNGSVDIRDVQLFLKRLRYLVEPRLLRYYAVGEYGDQTMRPHYHLALFGVGMEDSDTVRYAWSKGHVHLGTLTGESAAYVVSYVVKRMTKEGDPRLNGRRPEFARMSLKPGIGAGAVGALVSAMTSSAVARTYVSGAEVPSEIRWMQQKWPLGRYLLDKVCGDIGLAKRSPEVVAEHVLEEWSKALMVGSVKWREMDAAIRAASVQRAEVRVQISNSRKGIGI